MKDIFQVLSLFGRWTVDDDISEFCASIELDFEIHIRKTDGAIDLNVGMDLRSKVSIASEKRDERLLCFLDVDVRKRLLQRIVRDLEEASVCELIDAGKLVHAEVNCGLQDEHHSHALCIGTEIELDTSEFAGLLKCREGLIDLCSGEALARVLSDERREVIDFQIRLSCQFNRRHFLPFVGEDFSSVDGVLNGLLNACPTH